jgi:hypothetical protein
VKKQSLYLLLIIAVLFTGISRTEGQHPMELNLLKAKHYSADSDQGAHLKGDRETQMNTKTKITVRVQAKGGKYLGDDIGGAWVTIRNSQTGEILASGVTSGDSGGISDEYVPNASRRAIVTPGDPRQIHWVVANPITSHFSAELTLDHPAMLEISVFGATGGLQTAHKAIATAWAVPGNDIVVDIEISGLLVQVIEPTTHLQLPAIGVAVPLKANVAMMCGCPINYGMLWIPSDFEVSAQIRNLGSGSIVMVPLNFSTTGLPGTFEGSYNVTEPGFYEATILAVQRGTGNTGAGQVTFFTQP